MGLFHGLCQKRVWLTDLCTACPPPHSLLGMMLWTSRHLDLCVYTRVPWVEPPAPGYLDVLYEDEYVVAVAKPSGLQVLPAGPFYQRTALTLLRKQYAGQAGGQAASPTPVHRLGRGTSGEAGQG